MPCRPTAGEGSMGEPSVRPDADRAALALESGVLCVCVCVWKRQQQFLPADIRGKQIAAERMLWEKAMSEDLSPQPRSVKFRLWR